MYDLSLKNLMPQIKIEVSKKFTVQDKKKTKKKKLPNDHSTVIGLFTML